MCATLKKQIAFKLKTNGVVMPIQTRHSSLQATHKGMFTYIPANKTLLAKYHFAATFFAIVNTKDIADHIIKPWVDCSLTRECIAPLGSTRTCNFSRFYRFNHNCHRFDQAALNLVLSLTFKENSSSLYVKEQCGVINKWVTSSFLLKTSCGKNAFY